jgi:hypothetical protein
MRNNAIVVLFCGPRTKSGHPSTLRITRAIDVARSERVRLLIVGDAHDGADVDLFVSMAKEHGVERVTPVRVESHLANTEMNANQVALELKYAGYRSVNTVYLVTDHWHMQRATLHLQDALTRARATHAPDIIAINVTSAIELDKSVLDRERDLIAKFREDAHNRGEKISSAAAK